MIAADPNQTVEFFLPDDEHLPADNHPTFRGRYLTARQEISINALIEEAGKATDPEIELAKLCKAIEIGLTDWKNVVDSRGEPVLFGSALVRRPDDGLPGDGVIQGITVLPCLISREALWQLLGAHRAAIRLSLEDKKKLGSPSSASTGTTPGESAATPA